MFCTDYAGKKRSDEGEEDLVVVILRLGSISKLVV